MEGLRCSEQHTTTRMLKNYLKTAWRNLLRNKFYSLVTLTGLTAGLAVGILILLWVQDELSFDSFHRQASQIYKLENEAGTDESRQIWTVTTAPIGRLSKEELPEVKDMTRICYNGYYAQFSSTNKVIEEDNTVFTDPSFFTMFDFPLIKGNTGQPFTGNESVVLTRTTAVKYFGNIDVIGNVLTAEDSTRFVVSGVIEDFPANSGFRFDMLFPITQFAKKFYEGKDPGLNFENDFHMFNYSTYLLLRPDADLKSLSTRIRNIHLRMKPDDTDVAYLFLPLKKAHLFQSDGKEAGMETVRLFTIIALIILVIACINYVNLSTARSLLRAKEVSLRKIVGAGRRQLFIQFVAETALLFALAAALAMAIIPLLMPYFNTLAGKELRFDLANPQLWILTGGTILGTLLVSSIYPAILLSGFDPLKALKGKVAARINDKLFRRVLVVTQFAFSVILIVGTLVVNRQLRFMRDKNLGYDKEQVFTTTMRNMFKHYDAVKANLLNNPAVQDVTRTSAGSIIDISNQTGNNDFEGKAPNQTLFLSTMAVDQNFISFFKMQLKEGTGFTGTGADSARFLLNETAVRQMGLKNPIGKPLRLWGTKGVIAGVVKDFHFTSMKKQIEPAVFYYKPDELYRVYVRAKGKEMSQSLAALETEWKRYNPQFAYNYAFLNDGFEHLYRSEMRVGRLFNIFSIIAIIISCLGLLGLAAYTAQVRTREIGVRKVLGASVPGIVRLLATDFIRLVLIAILLAIPVAWFAMDRWLQDFAYRTSLSAGTFILAGVLAIGIALLTISIQSIRAALANPVRSLRSE
mgnify:CR=1 FL=1